MFRFGCILPELKKKMVTLLDLWSSVQDKALFCQVSEARVEGKMVMTHELGISKKYIRKILVESSKFHLFCFSPLDLDMKDR